jgi:hypothetical protein
MVKISGRGSSLVVEGAFFGLKLYKSSVKRNYDENSR